MSSGKKKLIPCFFFYFPINAPPPPPSPVATPVVAYLPLLSILDRPCITCMYLQFYIFRKISKKSTERHFYQQLLPVYSVFIFF